MGKASKRKKTPQNERYFARFDSQSEFKKEFKSFLETKTQKYIQLFAIADFNKCIVFRHPNKSVCLTSLETFEKDISKISKDDFLYKTYKSLLDNHKNDFGLFVIYVNQFMWMEGIFIEIDKDNIANLLNLLGE
jgi:hypothetical protein